MSDLISRQDAISHPFANGKYDKENANENFILGFESYKEWLEQLPSAESEAYNLGWKEGREALRKEIWEDGRDRID